MVSQNPQSITPDSPHLIIFENDPKFGPGVATFTLSSASNAARKVEPLVQTSFIEWGGEVSPDSRWLADASNESGQFEVYVRPFPGVDGGKWQVSSGGGTKPVWARDGSELFCLDNTNNVVAASVHVKGSTFANGNPTKVVEGQYFSGAPPARAYDVAPDDQRFLMLKERDGDA